MQIGMEETKLYLFTNMIVYVENSKETIKKILVSLARTQDIVSTHKIPYQKQVEIEMVKIHLKFYQKYEIFGDIVNKRYARHV